MTLRKLLGITSLATGIAVCGVAAAADYSVEDLTLRKSHSNAWGVTGKIRNGGSSPLHGYVKIKFLDSAGDITKSAQAYVNDNDPFGPGQAAPFEYWTSPSDYSGVKNFRVIFVEKK